MAGHITEVPADPGPSVAKMTPPFLYMEWPPHDSKMMLLVTSVNFSLDLTGVHNFARSTEGFRTSWAASSLPSSG